MSGTGRKPRFVYEFRGDASLSTFRGLISASSMVAPTGFEPVFESRSRFRQVSYVVTEQQHPATSTRLKHAAESSLKHPEHDHVKREPGGPSPDERKLQNNFRTGAVEAAASRTQFWLRRVHEVRVAMGTIQRIFRDWSGQDIYLLTTIYSRRPTHDVVCRETAAWACSGIPDTV